MSVNFKNFTNKISNCSGDENRRLKGGKAGDQTKTQWCIKNWYNRPWTCVLRHPDQQVRQLIAELGIEAANNNLIGYDQNQRTTYWVQLKQVGFRPLKITVACEADCSAGVIANVRAAGYILNIDKLKNINASYTGDMKSGFKKAGFEVLTDSKYLKSSDYLLPGDILLYEGHHTATNLGIGSKVKNYIPIIDQKKKKDQETNKKNEQKVKEVNKKETTTVTKKITQIPINTTGEYSKKVAATGKITALLNIRKGPGKTYTNLVSYPVLKKDTKVGICDAVKAANGTVWYYIKISGSKGQKYGFASANFIKLV